MINFWQGSKVKLRAIEKDDAATIFTWNQDSERASNLDFVWPPSSMVSVQAWIEEQSKSKFENETFSWMIENIDGEPVGGLSTHNCNSRYGTFSYGVDIAYEHRKKGYATEAIQLVLKYYFEELRYQKVTINIHSYNEPSILLHQSLGFQKEGIHRRMGYTQGDYFDLIWFGMTVEEFRSIR